MTISRIHIKNYRAFEDISLELNSNINVLYGINGIGKSSLLFAIHELFQFVNLFVLTKNSQTISPQAFIFSESRIRNLDEEAKIEIEFVDGNRIAAIYNIKGIKETTKENYPVKVEETQNLFIGIKSDNIVNFKSYFPCITAEPDEIQVVANFKQNFGIHDEPLYLKVNNKPQYVSSRGIDYTRFTKTFEECENLENQKIVRDGEHSYRDPALEKIREGIGLVFGYFEDIHVDRTKPGNPIVVKKHGTYLNLDSQLSAGEANIIALISSIALNLYKDGANSNSIVLIDEIENCLHSRLQCNICSVLKKLFKDTQFIISSHSPFVWKELNRDEIVWLVHDCDNENHVTRANVDYAIGGSIEDICAKFF